jgi:rhamnosyltransferase
MPSPQKDSVCAVIVTFHPDAGFIDRFHHIADQVGRIVIVDNGSDESILSSIVPLAVNASAKFIKNGKNLGIATALNQGLQVAHDEGYPWIICFDQDSLVFPDMFDELARIYEEILDKDTIAVIGVNSVDPATGITFLRHTSDSSDGYLLQMTVITSGSLLPVALVLKLGGFRSDFFIDHVDHEFCLKARQNGYKIYTSRKVLMEHSIGAYEIHSLCGVKILCLNHSPLRWYYIVRNFVVLVREYYMCEPIWLIKTFIYFLIFLFGASLYEQERRSKLRHVWVGLLDGWNNRMGQLRQER